MLFPLGQGLSRGLFLISHKGNEIISEMDRPLLEKGLTVFVRYNEAVEILHKIRSFNERSFAEVVHPAMTFGLRTFYKTFDSQKSGKGLIKLYANHSQGYIYRSKLSRGQEYVDSWKVYIPEAIGTGNMTTDIIKPIIGEPESASTETYIMNGPWKSEEEARNVITYIKTKFFHFLLGLKKNTQHTTQAVYEFVPMQDFSKSWTDEELYAKYGLTEKEIAFIESMIRPMELGGDDNGN